MIVHVCLGDCTPRICPHCERELCASAPAHWCTKAPRVKHCARCGHDVAEVAWVGDEAGQHAVVVETTEAMRFSMLPGDYTRNEVRIMVERDVRFTTCAELLDSVL